MKFDLIFNKRDLYTKRNLNPRIKFASTSKSTKFEDILPWYILGIHGSRDFKITSVSISSALKQKGQSQSGCYKKTKHEKFSEKRTFLTPLYAHARVRIRG